MTTTTDHRANPRRPRLTIHQKSEIMKHFKEHGLNGKEISELMKIPHHQVLTYLAKIRTSKGAKREERKLHKELDDRPKTKKFNRTPPTVEQVEYIRENFGSMPAIRIAKNLGLSVNTVTRYANPEYRKNHIGKPTKSYHKAGHKTHKTSSHSVPTTSALIEEIKAEIRAELKAKLMKEILGE